jgi:hypothetical protein
MPRFTGQNKKRKNPRYFLNEEVDTGEVHMDMEDPDDDSDDAEELMNMLNDEAREEIASSLRTYEKDLTGRKGSFLSDEEIATMSKEDLIQYIRTVMDTSPEAADLEAEFQAQDDKAMGYEDEVDPMSMEPKMEPMGRIRRRGMRENNGRTSK